VIVRLDLLPLVLIAAGAVSFQEGCAPAAATAPPTVMPVDGLTSGPPQNTPRLEWRTRRDGVGVELVGADPLDLVNIPFRDLTIDLWSSFFTVRVVPEGNAGSKENPPLWGSYRLEGDTIRFVPRFPLEPGMRYLAELDPARLHVLAQELGSFSSGLPRTLGSTVKLVTELSLPKKRAQSTTQVAGVYPTSDMLPENLLRFYVYFSAPMSRGEAYRHIKLIDSASNKPVDSPFLELGEELWSSDGNRFTLLFDPGRIKRGLKPREEVGPVLEVGKSYSLVIGRDWPDALGSPLASEFRKFFRAGPPDDVSPDPKTWNLQAPREFTRDPLLARFPEPMDRALLERLISVHDAAGRVVAGRISLAEKETLWRFTPQGPWRPGEFRLVIGTELEDLAGNSVARPFEVDLTGPISKQVATERVELPFRITPSL
jgi:hypothetical protein